MYPHRWTISPGAPSLSAAQGGVELVAVVLVL